MSSLITDVSSPRILKPNGSCAQTCRFQADYLACQGYNKSIGKNGRGNLKGYSDRLLGVLKNIIEISRSVGSY
jgi:hypothetical protein